MNTLLKKYRKQRYAWLWFLLFSKIEGSLPIALRILLSLQPFCCNIYRKYYQENKKVKSTSGNTALKIIEKLESLVSNLRLKYSQMFSLLYYIHTTNLHQDRSTFRAEEIIKWYQIYRIFLINFRNYNENIWNSTWWIFPHIFDRFFFSVTLRETDERWDISSFIIYVSLFSHSIIFDNCFSNLRLIFLRSPWYTPVI